MHGEYCSRLQQLQLQLQIHWLLPPWATATTFKRATLAPTVPTKEPNRKRAPQGWTGWGSNGNPSIIKNAICTNKFEWERAEGAADVAAAAAIAAVEEQSIWLLNLTIRIYQ